MILNDFILKCYQAWIDENIPKDEIFGNCSIWSRVMHQAFPELIIVGGYAIRNERKKDDFFYDASPSFLNKNYHEYLITENGDIVDPTAVQFDKLLGCGNWHYERCEEHLLY